MPTPNDPPDFASIPPGHMLHHGHLIDLSVLEGVTDAAEAAAILAGAERTLSNGHPMQFWGLGGLRLRPTGPRSGEFYVVTVTDIPAMPGIPTWAEVVELSRRVGSIYHA